MKEKKAEKGDKEDLKADGKARLEILFQHNEATNLVTLGFRMIRVLCLRLPNY